MVLSMQPRSTAKQLALLAFLMNTLEMVGGHDPRCQLPEAMKAGLDAFATVAVEGGGHAKGQARDVSVQQNVFGKVVGCFMALHAVFLLVCDRLFELPVVARLQHGTVFEQRVWLSVISAWAAGSREVLRSWGTKQPECMDPHLQLRIGTAFLDDFGQQLHVLAKQTRSLTGALPALQWLIRFQGTWSMAMYYATCLQYFSLAAFDAANDLAFALHRHRTQYGTDWWGIALMAPTIRVSQTDPLRINEPPGAAVMAALRKRLSRGRRVRFVEVGVFRANLSNHIWRRAARLPGSLEMHLVDHWGDASLPGGETKSVGTGSDMAGSSNTSVFRSVVRGFSRAAAHCVQVPYWVSAQASRVTVALGGDVFFHRSTSVAAAETFKDGTLDLVYIDADHKWWSVVQDLAAWWPKVRPGGVMLGHDFHLNPLMEREDAPGGDSNDVPLSVFAFFRAPHQVVLHSGFVWSVEKLPSERGDSIGLPALCDLLRERMAPHWDFEVCTSDN